MEKIEKYFPHSTMQQFMQSLNEETLEGVFTVRLTPLRFIPMIQGDSEFIWKPEDIRTWLTQLEEHDKFSKAMAFREVGAKCGEHYHIRFVTKFKTRKSLADLIKDHFPIPQGVGQGNTAYSIRDCKAKDKTIWKSATYIAKDGDCIYRHGYSHEDISYFVEYSHKLKEFRGYPKFEQIIYRYQLQRKSMAELTGKSIFDAVIDFHKLRKIEIPPLHRVKNIMHNICYKLSSDYRVGFEETITGEFEYKLHGNFM